MNIKALVAAAAIATASTAAVAQDAQVTTDAGEVVMIEKNAALGLLGQFFVAGLFTTFAVTAGAGS